MADADGGEMWQSAARRQTDAQIGGKFVVEGAGEGAHK